VELAGEHGLGKFHSQFEKLFYTLKQVHENERRLTHKCRQLNEEISQNVAKVSAALEITQEEGMISAVVRQVNRFRNHNNLIKVDEDLLMLTVACVLYCLYVNIITLDMKKSRHLSTCPVQVLSKKTQFIVRKMCRVSLFLCLLLSH